MLPGHFLFRVISPDSGCGRTSDRRYPRLTCCFGPDTDVGRLRTRQSRDLIPARRHSTVVAAPSAPRTTVSCSSTSRPGRPAAGRSIPTAIHPVPRRTRAAQRPRVRDPRLRLRPARPRPAAGHHRRAFEARARRRAIRSRAPRRPARRLDGGGERPASPHPQPCRLRRAEARSQGRRDLATRDVETRISRREAGRGEQR